MSGNKRKWKPPVVNGYQITPPFDRFIGLIPQEDLLRFAEEVMSSGHYDTDERQPFQTDPQKAALLTTPSYSQFGGKYKRDPVTGIHWKPVVLKEKPDDSHGATKRDLPKRLMTISSSQGELYFFRLPRGFQGRMPEIRDRVNFPDGKRATIVKITAIPSRATGEALLLLQ